jgi:ADP-heptose:LPS heptosyltransferase
MSVVELTPKRASKRRIAVFRALQLGDLLCAVPALRAIRKAFHDDEITLIGLPWAAEFVRRFSHLIDRFVEFPGFPGLPEREPDIDALPDFLREAQAAHYDLAIQMHGRGDLTNAIVATLGARAIAGFYPRNCECPDRLRFVAWPEVGTEVHRCLALTDFLRLPRDGDMLEFPVRTDEKLAADALLARHGLLTRRFVCIHPGARLYTRRWPAEYFSAVARDVLRLGYSIVLTGSVEEALITRRISRDLGGAHVVDLAGQTSLGVLASIQTRARLLVCNDTGVSHIAAALRVPSVIVCCGADASRFAPLDHVLHEVLHHPIACRPCAHVHCPIGHPCAHKLSPERVSLHVRARLAPRRPDPTVRFHGTLRPIAAREQASSRRMTLLPSSPRSSNPLER